MTQEEVYLISCLLFILHVGLFTFYRVAEEKDM
jgi:hypothetical protein